MKALSITAWWAWAIVHAGKDIENRTWGTSYRGPLLIHASKKVLDSDWYDAHDIILSRLGGPHPTMNYPRMPDAGGIVGRCVLADCVRRHDSPWFFGPYGFVLTDVEPVEFVPMRGQLGLFDCDLPKATP